MQQVWKVKRRFVLDAAIVVAGDQKKVLPDAVVLTLQ